MSKEYYQKLIEESNRKLMEIEDRNSLRKILLLKNSVKFSGLNDLFDQHFGPENSSEPQQTTTVSECSAQDDKIKELNETLNFFKEKYVNLTNEINKIPSKTQIEDEKERIKILQSDNEDLSEEISKLKASNKELKDKIIEFKTKQNYLNQLKSTFDELKTQTEDLHLKSF